MQRIDLAHGLIVEGPGRRRLVKVEISPEDFVGTLARKHHLHAHRLDAPRHQVHRRRGADGGDVIGLDVADDVGQRVEALLHRELELVMAGTQRLGDDARRGQVRRAFQPDREGMQARPPRFFSIVRLHAMFSEARRTGCDQ